MKLTSFVGNKDVNFVLIMLIVLIVVHEDHCTTLFMHNFLVLTLEKEIDTLHALVGIYRLPVMYLSTASHAHAH